VEDDRDTLQAGGKHHISVPSEFVKVQQVDSPAAEPPSLFPDAIQRPNRAAWTDGGDVSSNNFDTPGTHCLDKRALSTRQEAGSELRPIEDVDEAEESLG